MTTVRAFYAALDSGRYDIVPALSCDARKGQAAEVFSPTGQLGSAGVGLSMTEFADLWAMDVSGLSVIEKSRTVDSAVVNATGIAQILIDRAKFLELAERTRGPLTDAEAAEVDRNLDQLLALIGGATAFDHDMTLVLEDGGWLICSSFRASEP